LTWDESIRYHRYLKNNSLEGSFKNIYSKIDQTAKICQPDNLIEKETDSEEENDEECSKLICLSRMASDESVLSVSGKSLKVHQLIEAQNTRLVPQLMIKDDGDYKNASFPNVYQLLQCFTLKSANDDFDMERYEILGDCFLKLTIVMKIYIDFFKTNEGKMVELKSIRASNKYLFKLSIKKNFSNYVISENYDQKFVQILFGLENYNEKLKLADKSLADCVEALIGLYLINLGQTAAKSFISWLDFTISEQNGKDKFLDKIVLPNPLIGNQNKDLIQNKLNYLKSFEEKIINYKFNNIVYLYQAFTHPSDFKNKYTSSYQKYIF
jgi:dsRNA-specific ribonuclease